MIQISLVLVLQSLFRLSAIDHTIYLSFYNLRSEIVHLKKFKSKVNKDDRISVSKKS